MPSEESYIDQRPDALRLTLVEGDLDQQQFHVFAAQDRNFTGFDVRAKIIGASHVISVRMDDYVLHEVFACIGLLDVPSWTLEQLVQHPVRREFSGLKYEFSAHSIDWRDPEPLELLELVGEAKAHAQVSGFGLVQEFPAGGLAVTPKTVIVGEAASDDRLVIRSAHSYPNVRALTLSRSVLTYTQEV